MAKKENENFEKQRDIIPTEGGAVATYDYGQDKGAGFEQTSGKDLSIPFIQVLQSNSPQVESNSPAGSKVGLLYNSVTGALYEANYDGQNPKAGLPFIPCFREDTMNEWVPRTSGGGLVNRYTMDDDVVKKAIAEAKNKFGKIALSNGNDLVQTHYVYGLTLTADGKEVDSFAVVSCSGTKIKPFKNWFTNLYMLKGQPPLFAHRTLIQTFPDSNKKGKYANFRFMPLFGDIQGSLINPISEKPLLEAARQFREMVASGQAKAAAEHRDPGEPEVAEDHDPTGDGKAPF